MKFRIRTMNKIASAGLDIFDKNFKVDAGCPNPHGILVRSARINLDHHPELLAVARAGTGVNNIPVEAATEKGICVFNAPGANANAVAELVFTMMGLASRHIEPSLDFIHSLKTCKDNEEVMRAVESNKSHYKGTELVGKHLGVVGLGRIGVLVANYGIHHGMSVSAFDPFPTMWNIHQLMPEVKIKQSLFDLLAGMDFLSVHVPLNEKTSGLINGQELRRLNKGAVVLNYSRSGIVGEDAILKSLAAGKISNYITDFPTLDLLNCEGVICTPHLGASTSESEEKCALMAARTLKSYLEYGNISRSVNFPVIEAPRQKSTRSRLIVVNRDVPGMIASITDVVGKAGINIQSMSNVSNGSVGYNIIDTELSHSDPVIKAISRLENVIRVREIRFSSVA